jgi:peptidoglycan lytic transglycosylase
VIADGGAKPLGGTGCGEFTPRASRAIAVAIAVVVAISVGGCATRQAPYPALGPTVAPASPTSVTGVASWYGPGFNGHRTSSGAVYEQDDLTAASVLFPLGSRVLVTNLRNGRSVEVTINDHGPYVKGRGIDLSRKAARVLGVIGPGTATVRMDVIATPAGGPALGQRYFVQVGSFADPGNARRIRDRLAAYYPDVRIDPAIAGANRYYRVRMGAFMRRAAAQDRAMRVAAYGYRVVIVTE